MLFNLFTSQANSGKLLLLLLASNVFSKVQGASELTLPSVRAFYNADTQTITTTILHPPLLDDAQILLLNVRYYDKTCENSVADAAGTLDETFVAQPTADPDVMESSVSNTLAAIRGVTSPVLFEEDDKSTSDPNDDTAEYAFCVEYELSIQSTGDILDTVRYDVALAASLDGSVDTGVDVTTDIDSNTGSDTFTVTAYVCTAGTLDPVTDVFFRFDTVAICLQSNDYPEASIVGMSSFSISTTLGIGHDQAVWDGTAGGFVTGVGNGLTACVGTPVEKCGFTVPLDEAFFNILATSFPTNGDSTELTASGVVLLQFGDTRRLAKVRMLQADLERSAEVGFLIQADDTDSGADDDGCGLPGFLSFFCPFIEMVRQAFRSFMNIF